MPKKSAGMSRGPLYERPWLLVVGVDRLLREKRIGAFYDPPRIRAMSLSEDFVSIWLFTSFRVHIYLIYL